MSSTSLSSRSEVAAPTTEIRCADQTRCCPSITPTVSPP